LERSLGATHKKKGALRKNLEPENLSVKWKKVTLTVHLPDKRKKKKVNKRQTRTDLV